MILNGIPNWPFFNKKGNVVCVCVLLSSSHAYMINGWYKPFIPTNMAFLATGMGLESRKPSNSLMVLCHSLFPWKLDDDPRQLSQLWCEQDMVVYLVHVDKVRNATKVICSCALCPYGLSNDVSASLATLPLMYMFVLNIMFIISPNPHCRVSCYSIGLKPPIYWDVPSSPAWLLYRRLFVAVAPWRSVAELSAVGCRDFERRKAAMNLKKWAAERAAVDGISCLTHGECIKNVSWTCFNPENGCGRPSAKATKSGWMLPIFTNHLWP